MDNKNIVGENPDYPQLTLNQIEELKKLDDQLPNFMTSRLEKHHVNHKIQEIREKTEHKPSPEYLKYFK